MTPRTQTRRSTSCSAPNTALALRLDEAGMSPRRLARRINALAGIGTVDVTTPYHWRDKGGLPRDPLPELVARVLSQELGRRVTVEELWGGRARTSATGQASADHGMSAHPWDHAGFVALLQDWLDRGPGDTRLLLPVYGPALTEEAGVYLSQPQVRAPAPRAGREPAPPLGGLLTHLARESALPLRHLDDAVGGAVTLGFVAAQFHAMAEIACRRSPLFDRDGTGHTQLTGLMGELGQLAGWTAYDAGRAGLAQRHWLTALRAAHLSGDRALAAHVLSLLAYQCACAPMPGIAVPSALRLAAATLRAAQSVPAGVVAMVAARAAHAYAAAGDIAGFEDTHTLARRSLAAARPHERPSWAYFVSPAYLDTQRGRAAVRLAYTLRDEGRTSQARSWAQEGVRLLAKASDMPIDGPSVQREALISGTWLALGHALVGDLEHTCIAGLLAVRRLDRVHSQRAVDGLRQLRLLLARRTTNTHVRDFLPRLDAALRASDTWCVPPQGG